MQKDKIGLGLITCDRYNFLEKSLLSVFKATSGLDDNFFKFILIDDTSSPIPEGSYDFANEFNLEKIHTTGEEGVGIAKNKALKALIDADCEHIFLMEDDVEMLDASIFEKYINASRITGIKHLNFALHGNHNRDFNSNPTPRRTINYPDNETRIVLYPNILGAFSYYHIDVLNEVGLIDEQFYNALEHVDHTYQIIKAGYHPYFRWFADIEGSEKYLKDIVPDHMNSKIRSEQDFVENFMKNHDRFVSKNNFAVVYGKGPIENTYTEEEVVKNLQEIWKKHHYKE